MGKHFKVQNNILCPSFYRLSGSDIRKNKRFKWVNTLKYRRIYFVHHSIDYLQVIKEKQTTVQVGKHFKVQNNILCPSFYRLSGSDIRKKRFKWVNTLKYRRIYFVHHSIDYLQVIKENIQRFKWVNTLKYRIIYCVHYSIDYLEVI